MGEFKFSCPLCSQHIACDTQYSGRQIQCPGCQGTITVPTPASGVRVAAATRKPQAAPANAAGAQGSRSAKSLLTPRVLVIAAGVLALPVAFYFGFTAVQSWQRKMNAARERDAQNSGGQLAHIAELNQVLDATDPSRISTLPASTDAKSTPEPASAPPETATSSTSAPAPSTGWTLDLDAARIPDQEAGGMIGGNAFQAGAVFLDVSGPLNVLSFRESTNATSQGEVYLYLRLKQDESIGGRTWNIPKDLRTGGPQILKRWKTPTRIQQKTFYNGYALKLEFGQVSGTSVPGKLYLALPDEEQSIVAGKFTATMRVAAPRLVTTTAPQAPRPTQTYVQPRQTMMPVRQVAPTNRPPAQNVRPPASPARQPTNSRPSSMLPMRLPNTGY